MDLADFGTVESDLRDVLVFSPQEWTAILLSLKVAFFASAVSFLPAIAVAYVLARFNFRGKILLDSFVHLPLVLPPVVTGLVLLLLLGTKGPIGSLASRCCHLVFAFRWTGAVVASAVMAFPLFVRAVRISFEAIDPRLEKVAATLGAGPWRVFWTITLPLARNGVLAGLVLTFAKSLGEFGATITFVANIPGQTQTIATAIYSDLAIPGGELAALRLSLLCGVIAVVALGFSQWLEQRQKARR